MRVLRTTRQLHAKGLTREKIRSGERHGKWRRVIKGVYGAGPEPPTALDRFRATAFTSGGIALSSLAGVLCGWDSVRLSERREVAVLADANGGSARHGVRRVKELPSPVVERHQVRCTDGPTTLWALAPLLDDTTFEQVLESALRKKDVTRDDLAAMAARSERRSARVRRVLEARGGLDVPATESLLETLMVQLIRTVPGLPPPERQVEVYDEHGTFVARVDLAWPSLGIFIELDGQQHLGQPVYDASRQTAVVAATGWLIGRFTWYEVNFAAETCRRRLLALHRHATAG